LITTDGLCSAWQILAVGRVAENHRLREEENVGSKADVAGKNACSAQRHRPQPNRWLQPAVTGETACPTKKSVRCAA
jgi:hypothetical protein